MNLAKRSTIISARQFIEVLSFPGTLSSRATPHRGKIYRALKKNLRCNYSDVLLCCPLSMRVTKAGRTADMILGNVAAFLEDVHAQMPIIHVVTDNLVNDDGNPIINALGNKFAICVKFLTQSPFPPVTPGDSTSRPGGVQPPARSNRNFSASSK